MSTTFLPEVISTVPLLERCDQGGCEERATCSILTPKGDLVFCQRHQPDVDPARLIPFP